MVEVLSTYEMGGIRFTDVSDGFGYRILLPQVERVITELSGINNDESGLQTKILLVEGKAQYKNRYGIAWWTDMGSHHDRFGSVLWLNNKAIQELISGFGEVPEEDSEQQQLQNTLKSLDE